MGPTGERVETGTRRDLGFLEAYTIGLGTMIGAGIEYATYGSRVAVADDVERAVFDAAAEYDTVRVGARRSGAVSQALFGSLPETVGERPDRTVVMARGSEELPMSIRGAIVRRLEG